MRACLTVLLFLINGVVCHSQNTIGIPDIVNYTKDLYNAGTQNRAIAEDKNGTVYFANYEGLLSFDGTYWKTYPLSNKTVVLSLAIARDSRIYVGGQGDFGYFSPDKNGILTYTSLKGLVPGKDSLFTDVWNIIPYGNDVFFRSREKIFQLREGALTVYPAPSNWLFLGLSNNQLVAQDEQNGLLLFSGGMWTPFVKQNALPKGGLVTCILPIGGDSSLLTTINTGFFVLSRNNITPFQFAGPDPTSGQRILTAIPVTRDWIAVGTNLGGCYIINKKGEIIQNLSRKEGLQNNNILCLFLDNNDNLWLGLDNGIDFIAYNNAIKHIYPEKLNEGLGYSSLIHNNFLYVGTSNGLYRVPISGQEDLSLVNGEFQSIPGTKGSAWGLSEVNGALLLGHHDGAFQVQNDKVVSINSHAGYWTYLPFYNVLPSSLVIAGNDQGIDLLHYDNPTFVSKGNIPGFRASSQFIAIDRDNIVWVAHPYLGVYRIDLSGTSPRIKLYTNKNGLPSSLKNHVFKVKGRIAVTTERGVYEYHPKTDSFSPSPYFQRFFGDNNIRLLKEDPEGNIWFIQEKNLGVVDFSGPVPQTIYFPELNSKMVTDFEHIYPYNAANIFVGAEKGFYHINYSAYRKNRYPLQVKIRSVRAFGKSDSLLFGGYFGEVDEVAGQPADNIAKVANAWNSLHFEYSAPLYAAQNSVEYSYELKGFDKDWSAWSKKTEKEYTSLPAGTYTFQVKAKSNLGNESGISSYSFTVRPPWYQTTWAYAAYILLLITGLYLLIRWQRHLLLRQQRKHEEEQRRLLYLHQLELEKSEKEIVKLKNEKLEAEIEHKNSALASSAMHLLQKGELLSNIREEFAGLKKDFNGEASPEKFKKILRILGEENKMDNDWDQFAAHFDKVHRDFLLIMKQHYPGLSAHELKLCAYLRMNLSSKEIAQLENISVRGVELGRYRLRKKLGVPKEAILFDFLLGFTLSSS
jgi:DNA-binding CsgD family transcriptional regulator